MNKYIIVLCLLCHMSISAQQIDDKVSRFIDKENAENAHKYQSLISDMLDKIEYPDSVVGVMSFSLFVNESGEISKIQIKKHLNDSLEKMIIRKIQEFRFTEPPVIDSEGKSKGITLSFTLICRGKWFQ